MEAPKRNNILHVSSLPRLPFFKNCEIWGHLFWFCSSIFQTTDTLNEKYKVQLVLCLNVPTHINAISYHHLGEKEISCVLLFICGMRKLHQYSSSLHNCRKYSAFTNRCLHLTTIFNNIYRKIPNSSIFVNICNIH